MIAPKLEIGKAIGLCAPSHVADRTWYEWVKGNIGAQGYQVVEGDNMYRATHGYLAAPQERAADLHQLFLDEQVGFILFGGGEGAGEVLPYLDFDLIRRHPKRISSYSDGTSILNPIYANTGLVTYYGMAPRVFDGCSDYDMQQFRLHITEEKAENHRAAGSWQTLRPGTAQGVLVGGYARNFALMLGSKYCPLPLEQDYVLIVEDHEMFGGVDYVSAMLSHMEQHDFFDRVRGVLFGHYSEQVDVHLLERLTRLADMHHIPVAYCDDFGHGQHHGILEIGRECVLDTGAQTIRYL